MNKRPLCELVTEKGQAAMAQHLGCSAAAISKAISSGRDIHVNCHDDGTFTAEEMKPFPSQAARPSAA